MSANGKRPAFEDLTKRELFAAMAMQGVLSNHRQYDDMIKAANAKLGRTEEAVLANYACTAMMAIEYADALLRKLEEGK